MPGTILLVEDEAAIAENVIYALRTEGFTPLWTTLGSEALSMLQQQAVDLVLLDVGLPDANGFEVCKAIRQKLDIPIVFLTARSEEIDRIVGLEIGADDYVVKPFSPRELVARVRTILRRVQANHAAPAKNDATDWFEVDEARARIAFKGKALDLTRFEYFLLKTLLTQPERVFTRAQLLESSDAAPASMERSIDTHVKTLRAKLREIAPDIDPIQTHRGLGYSILSAPAQ